MSATEGTGSPVLIGTLFCEAARVERGVRFLLRAQALLASHPEYVSDSQMGRALRDTRIGLIALRELLEAGTELEVPE